LKKIAITLSAIGITALGFTLWGSLNSVKIDNASSSHNTSAKKTSATPKELTPEVVKVDRVNAFNLSDGSLDHHRDAMAALPESETDGLDDRSFWFEEPLLTSDSHFTEAQTELQLTSSCDGAPYFSQPQSLEKTLEETHALPTTERFPEDLFYFSLTQFWRIDNDFYQFVALWERDMPAKYRYEFYRSNDALFEAAVTPLNFPIEVPALKDVQQTNSFVRSLVNFYLDQGATLGARILEASINGEQKDEQIVLVNSHITHWSTPEFSCLSSAKSHVAKCHCHVGDKA